MMRENGEPSAGAVSTRSAQTRLVEIAIWVLAPLVLIVGGWVVAVLLGAPGPRVIVVASLVALGLGGFHLWRPGAWLPVRRARSVGLIYAGLVAAFAQVPSAPPADTPATAAQTASETFQRGTPARETQISGEAPSEHDPNQTALYPWPFSVPTVTLACRSPTGRGSGMVTVTTPDGREYAVNGTARRSYPEVDAIWRTDPEIPGARINIGPVIERGLMLCTSAGRASSPIRIVAGDAPVAARTTTSTEPAAPLPQIDEASLYIRFANVEETEGAVRGQIETNITLPVEIMVGVALRGQRPDDTFVGNDARVRLTSNPQAFSIPINVRGGLPSGDYDVEATFYPRWGANNSPPEARAIRREIRATQRITLRGNGGSVRDTTAMNNARRWLMENTAMGDRWNPAEFERRMGPSERMRVTNRTEIIVAYYYPRADATVFVNTLTNELVVWRLGRTDTL